MVSLALNIVAFVVIVYAGLAFLGILSAGFTGGKSKRQGLTSQEVRAGGRRCIIQDNADGSKMWVYRTDTPEEACKKFIESQRSTGFTVSDEKLTEIWQDHYSWVVPN